MTTEQTMQIIRQMGLDIADLNRLEGAREIEWGWVISALHDEGGQCLLDFGCGRSPIPLWAAMMGYNVTAVDLEHPQWQYRLPSMHLCLGDIRGMIGSFDTIVNCSSIEHVGIAGRYGVVANDPDGDLGAMEVLLGMLEPNGRMILTTAVGRDSVYSPLHRIYGRERLPLLFDGYQVANSQYWARDDLWHITSESDAMDRGNSALDYALGLYILRKEER